MSIILARIDLQASSLKITQPEFGKKSGGQMPPLPVPPGYTPVNGVSLNS